MIIRKVLILSFHAFNSPNKAGFHFIAEEYSKNKRVIFVTTGLSLFSRLKNDPRYYLAIESGSNKKIIKDNDSSVEFFSPVTLFHPIYFRIKLLDKVLYNLFKGYGSRVGLIEKEILSSDLIIVESCYGIMWLNFLFKKGLLFDKKIIYRVSDSLNILRVSSLLKVEEAFFLKNQVPFLVSCPSESIYHELSNLHHNVRIHHHGISIDKLSSVELSPYKCETKNAIFVGMSRIDYEAINVLANSYPDFNFHLIGNINFIFELKNIHNYGILRYEDTIKYIQHADIGLQTRITEGDKSLNRSLKVQQYTYFGLPIIGPSEINSGLINYFPYDSNNSESLISAFKRATDSLKFPELKAGIRSWEDLISDFMLS